MRVVTVVAVMKNQTSDNIANPDDIMGRIELLPLVLVSYRPLLCLLFIVKGHKTI